jgi:hypothetical protein
MDLLEELSKEIRAGHYHCALCFHPFATHDAKGKHMEDVHGYTTIEVTYDPERYGAPK